MTVTDTRPPRQRPLDPGSGHRLRARAAARTRTQSGYAAVMVMTLMLLLSATGLAILKSAQSSQENTQQGRAFTNARDFLDTAQSEALGKLNTGTLTYAPTDSGLIAVGDQTQYQQGYRYQVYTATAPTQYPLAKNSLLVTGSAGGKTQSAYFPLRARYVASIDTDSKGNKTYGIAAGGPASSTFLNESVWSAAVSTSADSNFQGTVSGEWDIYGGTATISTAPTYITTFKDGAFAANNSAATYPSLRSMFNGYMDRNILSQRVNEDSSSKSATCTAYSGTLAIGGYQCSTGGAVVGDAVDFVQGAGVTTLVAKGDVTIRGNVLSGLGGQLHIYTTGNVVFEKRTVEALNTTHTLTNVFVYAPQGTCSVPATSTSIRLNLTGSLACQSVSMPTVSGLTHSITGAQPQNVVARTNISNPSLVYYTEQAGFRDNRS